MGRSEILKQRQASLREDIASLLDSFLIGTSHQVPFHERLQPDHQGGGQDRNVLCP